MPRPRKPYWHNRDRCYKTRIDGREVILRNRDGTKVAHDDQRGVREAKDRLVAEHDATIQRLDDPTVQDVCSLYLEAASRECTRETMVGKEWVLKQWCEFGAPPHAERPARAITSVDLNRMGKAWRTAGYAPGMVRRLYQEVKACWAWAARPEPERVPVKILDADPLDGLRMPPGSRRTAKYLPLAEIRPLIAFALARAEGMGPLRSRFERDGAILMLRLIAETGCRPKEACHARWDDLDEEKGLLVLAEHKTAKKTGRLRVIVVPPAILEDLKALRRSDHAHPTHLFAHARGRGDASTTAGRETGAPWQRPGYSAWCKALVRQARAAKVPLPEHFTLYWLRSSYITDAIQSGLSADAAADLAGNTKEIARQHYHAAQNQYLVQTHRKVADSREPKDEKS